MARFGQTDEVAAGMRVGGGGAHRGPSRRTPGPGAQAALSLGQGR